jgi:hypothetical protein
VNDKFGYGRILSPLERVICKIVTHDKLNDVDEIAKHEIAFIVGSTDDGFYNKKYQLIGNLPLEEELKKPFYFYQWDGFDDTCRVSNIWDYEYPQKFSVEKVADCADIERWSSYSHIHIVRRLLAEFAEQD